MLIIDFSIAYVFLKLSLRHVKIFFWNFYIFLSKLRDYLTKDSRFSIYKDAHRWNMALDAELSHSKIFLISQASRWVSGIGCERRTNFLEFFTLIWYWKPVIRPRILEKIYLCWVKRFFTIFLISEFKWVKRLTDVEPTS